MSRGTLLVFLGVLIVASPFAGLPLSWLAWILPVLGVLVLIVGVSIRRNHASQLLPTNTSQQQA